MSREDGTDLPEPPAGSEWRYAWYCPSCGAELGEPGDAEPPDHCAGVPVAWEWALAPLAALRTGVERIFAENTDEIHSRDYGFVTATTDQEKMIDEIVALLSREPARPLAERFHDPDGVHVDGGEHGAHTPLCANCGEDRAIAWHRGMRFWLHVDTSDRLCDPTFSGAFEAEPSVEWLASVAAHFPETEGTES